MGKICTVRRYDSLSRWRRVAKFRRRDAVAVLRLAVSEARRAGANDPKMARAYLVAADLLEKLGEPR